MDASKITVVVVDDDPDLATSIGSVFELFGFNMKIFFDAESADKYLKNNKVEILISDIRMPNVTGVDLLNRVKSRDPQFPKVLLISGFTDYEESELYALGADGFFPKPFNMVDVKNAIKHSLLQPTDRWALAPSNIPSEYIKLSFINIDDASESDTFGIGRSGFFLPLEGGSLRVDDLVRFDISFETSHPVPSISGVGVVRWIRRNRNDHGLKGIGVETQFLTKSCLAPLAGWIDAKKIISFIPIN